MQGGRPPCFFALRYGLDEPAVVHTMEVRVGRATRAAADRLDAYPQNNRETMERAKAIAALIGWTIICVVFPPVVALLAKVGGMKKVLIWGGVLLVWAFFSPIVSVLAGMYAIVSSAPRVKRAGAKDRMRRYERERVERRRSQHEQEDWDQHIWEEQVGRVNERDHGDQSLPRPRHDMPPAWRR